MNASGLLMLERQGISDSAHWFNGRSNIEASGIVNFGYAVLLFVSLVFGSSTTPIQLKMIYASLSRCKG